jgi:hypothetical protein
MTGSTLFFDNSLAPGSGCFCSDKMEPLLLTGFVLSYVIQEVGHMLPNNELPYGGRSRNPHSIDENAVALAVEQVMKIIHSIVIQVVEQNAARSFLMNGERPFDDPMRKWDALSSSRSWNRDDLPPLI